MRPASYQYKHDEGDNPDTLLEIEEIDPSGSTPGTKAPTSRGGKQGRSSGGRRGSSVPNISAERPIFTLSVAADLLGLHPRTLRIYEEKRLVIPARTGGNRRRYSQNDIQRFQYIRRLTRGGVNLEGVRIILDMAEELRKLGSDPNDIIERNLQTEDES